jgi:hypothetical protein
MAAHDPSERSAVCTIAIHDRWSRSTTDQAKVAEHLRLANEARATLRNLILERKMRELLAQVAKVAAELNAKASA